MTLPTAILQLGQAITAAVLFSVALTGILHFTAAADAARSHIHSGKGAL